MRAIFAALFVTAASAAGVGASVSPASAAPLAAPGAQAEEADYIEYSGAASSRHDKHLLYGEQHVLSYRQGRLMERIVLYTCPNGAPFARKKVTYVDAQAPDFFLDDASNGMQEGVRSQGVGRYMFFRASRVEPQKSAPLPAVAGLVADAGFDEFIREHWSALMSGTEVPLRFLVPSRLQAMSFEVQYLHSDVVDGEPADVFRLKLTGLLGFFLPGVDVTYDRAQHVLVRFDGISDVRDASGDNLQANIAFHLRDRRPSSAQAFANAEQASIAPCP